MLLLNWRVMALPPEVAVAAIALPLAAADGAWGVAVCVKLFVSPGQGFPQVSLVGSRRFALSIRYQQDWHLPIGELVEEMVNVRQSGRDAGPAR